MRKMERVNKTRLLVRNKMESAKLKDRGWNGWKVLQLILEEQYVRRLPLKVISAELK
jgi:hypothetical protein